MKFKIEASDLRMFKLSIEADRLDRQSRLLRGISIIIILTAFALWMFPRFNSISFLFIVGSVASIVSTIDRLRMGARKEEMMHILFGPPKE